MNYDIDYLKKVLYDAGDYFMGQLQDNQVYSKGKDDYVTEVDLVVQDKIKTSLMAMYPHVQFISDDEVHEVDLEKPCWVLDPVDGTTNLIHDYHCSVISLALLEKGEPIIGLIYNPYMNELFYGVKGQGAYLNNHPIHVSSQENLSLSLVSVGTSPYYKDEETVSGNFNIMKEVLMRCTDIRRSGSATLDMVNTACGRVEAYLERNVKLWDYAAARLIVEEAGGIVCDYDGYPVTHEMNVDLITGSKEIVDILIHKCINEELR